MPERPVIKSPSVPPISNPGNDGAIVSQPGTQEIPQAMPQETPVAMIPAVAVPQPNDINSYMSEDQEISGLGSMRDFMAEGEAEKSAIGIEMREARRKLKTGEESDGLLIVNVDRNSAAAKAGLKPYKRMGHNILTGAAIGAAMVFPPAILVLPVIDYTEVGESYDMIIGVDGTRVTSFIEFEERMRNIQPGELVYLNVVRNGKRLQIPVPVPTLSTSASN
jgi:S1-C subfamily serine protease